MTEIIVSEGQSLVDVSLWLLGGVEGLFALADANGLAITDDLVAGQVLVVPGGFPVSANVVGYYQEKNLRVNTANRPLPWLPVDTDLVDFLITDFTSTDFL